MFQKADQVEFFIRLINLFFGTPRGLSCLFIPSKGQVNQPENAEGGEEKPEKAKVHPVHPPRGGPQIGY